MVDDETLRSSNADGDTATQSGSTATATQDGATPSRYMLTQQDFELVLPDHGYDLGPELGRGGMGEVLAAHDRRIKRDVAIKRMTARHPDREAVARFLREARIQARLDHPAIAPVHELGTDEAGRPFFAMKRLAGVTLADRLATNPRLRPLLHAFVDVCRAMRFAHERKVVHRDLKPSNVMLGEYGEVYVLDWGVAKVFAENERAASDGDNASLGDDTRTGAILGTPGYMAPEQIRGEPVSPSADVYSLGAVMFEILTGEPLHPRGQAALANTLATPQHSPASRKPECAIPPELDRACFEALDEVAARRPTVGELGERVQRYLDGDRDVERRRSLASDLVEQAQAALASKTPESHAIGMRLAGRALALDPESADAAGLVTANLLEPPRILPAACLDVLRREDAAVALQRRKNSVWMVLSTFVVALMLPVLEIRSWGLVIVFYGLHGIVIGFLLSSVHQQRGYILVLMISALFGSILWSQIASPLVLTPVMLCASILAFSANERVLTRQWMVVVWAMTGVMLPLILEWLGVIEPTVAITDNAISISSNMYEVRGAVALATIVVTNLVCITTVAFYALRTNRLAYDSRRNLSIRNWQLDQIVAHAREESTSLRPS